MNNIDNKHYRNTDTICGVGYSGNGIYKGSRDKNRREYVIWRQMIMRCYDSTNKDYERYGGRGCTVDETWHNFQNFCAWYLKEISRMVELGNDEKGLCVDKDILYKHNSIYSDRTCLIVPQHINKMVTTRKSRESNYPVGVSRCSKSGKFRANMRRESKATSLGHYNTPERAFLEYKYAKESYIKEMANKWRCKITDEIYDALMRYTVEITD